MRAFFKDPYLQRRKIVFRTDKGEAMNKRRECKERKVNERREHEEKQMGRSVAMR